MHSTRDLCLTNTAILRRYKIMVGWALTYVTTLRVYAGAVLARLRVFALIDISTVSTRLVKLKSFVTYTTEHSVDVFTFTKDT